MVDSIKITALQDIGANIAYTTLVPVVNMAGTPVTQKSNLQNLGNLILNGAGGSYFPRAAQATLALSVANAAQPNITSVGTLTSLAVTGNITAGNVNGGNIVVANFFYGDGGFLTNVAGGGSNYSNSNVAAYLPTYTGNISGDYLTLTHDVTANVVDANFLYGDASNVTNLPVGNIAVINLDGNVANVLHGDGSWSADQTTYSNSNVANYLPTYTGNIRANRVFSDANSGSNLYVAAGGAQWIFGEGGALYWPAPGANIWAIEPNIDNEFEIKSTNNVVISTDIANTNSHFTFDSTGIFTAPSNVNLLGSRLNVGPDAANAANLLNPTLVIANTGAQYIQAAIINNDPEGSSDWAADGAGGGDDEAWSDLGFTGYSFNDANFTITGPGDGYVFVQGYANGIGGHMVLATGDLGAENDIIFATGGFLANNEFARIDHANDVFHLTRAGSGIKFYDGTIQTTAGGGNPFDQDLNTTDNVTFANVTSTDAIRFSNSGNIVGGLGYAPNYVSIEGYQSNSVNITANDIYTWSFGSDGLMTLPEGAIIDTLGNNFEVRAVENVNLEANAVVNIYTDGSNNAYQWQFDDSGKLNLAGGGSIIESIANSSLDPTLPNVSTMTLTPDANYSSQVLVLDPTAPGHIHLRAYAFSNIDDPAASIFLGGEDTSFEITSGPNNEARIHSGGDTWIFGNDGNLTIPGSSGGFIKTVANSSIGIAAIDNGTDNPAQLLSINANGTATTALSAYATQATIQANINGDIKTWAFTNAGTATFPVVAYANLSAATTPGKRAFINDANLVAAGNFGNAVSGGGSNTVPVYSDGSIWRIG